MRRFADMGFRVRPAKEYLLFLLGLFSTWQIIAVGGLAVSTWLTLLTAGYLLLTQEFAFRRDWLLLGMLLSAGITFCVSMMANIPAGYTKASLVGTVQWVLIFAIYACVRRESTNDSADAFFRGFDWSCRIQLIWCFLQIASSKALGLNLNWLIFDKLLHLSDEAGLFENNMVSGLHWHVANLIPIVIYMYFRHKNILIKGCCLLIVMVTRSSTLMIAAGLCVMFDVLVFCKRTLCDQHCAIPYKEAVYILLGLMGVVAVSPILLPKVWGMIEHLMLRIWQISNPSEGFESSAVHFNYYRYLPDILKTLPTREVIAGAGFGTSGYRFTVFLWQYPNAIWTVESDPVNIILSQGILGAVLHYSFMGSLTWKLLRKKQTGLVCVLVILMICGFVYNNQFIWVQLVEFMLYCRVRCGAPEKAKEF